MLDHLQLRLLLLPNRNWRRITIIIIARRNSNKHHSSSILNINSTAVDR
jgi:hypothetical protein